MRYSLAIGVLVAVIALDSELAQADSLVPAALSSTIDNARAVRRLFAAKCSSCHGPDLARPKGRFGYVLDLRRIAENPEMVIPSSPDESELWILVKRGEMPPPDAPHGPLSDAEKSIVRDWIASGAHDVRTELSLESSRHGQLDRVEPSIRSRAVVVGEESVEATPAQTHSVRRDLRWFGRFHLLAIHFPIALMIAAAVGELQAARRWSSACSPAVGFCVRLAAMTALPTAALGWLFAAAGNGAGSPLLNVHRWLGSATAVWIIVVAVCCHLDERRGERSRLFQMLLAAGVLFTAVTAHVGASLVHGTDFFGW